ncbi:MAG: amidase domain-containing protein [Acetivibrionales bacterium]
MFLIINAGKKHTVLIAAIIAAYLISATLTYFSSSKILSVFSSYEKKIEEVIEDMFEKRNKAILSNNLSTLESFYDRNTRLGLWAYEHQVKKVKYLHSWAEKQGIKFVEVKSNIIVRRISKYDGGLKINFSAFTRYSYEYKNEPGVINSFKIGSYHSMDMSGDENRWVITREWYTDPFADSLNPDNIKNPEITEYIISGKPRDFSKINQRRKDAIEYADKYCGTNAEESYAFKYNKKYKNYNYMGGDCTNFASQVLYEGGKFKKNYTWNYQKDGSMAWLNANAFKSYLLYSGRASLIAYGTYNKVFKASYKLLPGDIVAYEKKGKIVHVSVVIDADSKGYSLVNCHNADRNRVPWDLGWSDKGIKFWLIHVHY